MKATRAVGVELSRAGAVVALRPPERSPSAAVRERAREAVTEPPRFVVGCVMAAIALIPLVQPRLPGNSGPADLVALVAVFAVALWVSSVGMSMKMPYAAGWTVLMTAGALSGLLAGRAGSSLLVVLQEVHLFLFCAAIATVARTPRALLSLRKAWTAAALGWGALLIAAVLLGIDSLVGASTERGARAHLFFQNPNITGSYFMVSFFVAASGSWPRRTGLRIVAFAILLTALFFSGSNAAMFGGAIGGLVAVAWCLWHRWDPAAAMVFAAAALAIGALGMGPVRDVMDRAQESQQPLIRYSIGRFERSAGKRQELFASQIELYRAANFMGIGPFATRDLLGAGGESGVRSSHNDYLATMVERGPLGVAGLVILAGAIGYRVTRSKRRDRGSPFARAAGTGAAAAGAVVALAASALTHEILHYRHLWALLGLIAAVHWWSPAHDGEATR